MSPDVLSAVQTGIVSELARRDPFVKAYSGSPSFCYYCSMRESEDRDVATVHRPDCLWLRAKHASEGA